MPNFSYARRIINPKGRMVYEYNPLFNYRPGTSGIVDDLITEGLSLLNFDLEHPVDIVCLKSYDGSVNLILNDGKNQPRLINTRFTARENNTYERVDRTGNTDTNLYDETEFEIDTSLLKKYVNIPKVNFSGVYYGGNLPVGNYTFYFKLSDGDGNETDTVAESGVVSIHMGSLNDPPAMRGGSFNENSGKAVLFLLTNLDSGYDYVSVYYSRTSSADNLQRYTQAVRITNRFRIRQNVCSIHITGNEGMEEIPVAALSLDFFLASSAKTQEVCLNMLFLGNVTKYTPQYEIFSKLSLGFLPFYESKTEVEEFGERLTETYVRGGYYDVNNIYNKVGYWNEEIYRFGIVYIMANGSLSPVYNIRGIDEVPKIVSGAGTPPNLYTPYDLLSIDYTTLFINNITLENSAGVCRIKETVGEQDDYFKIRHFVFLTDPSILNQLKDLNVKGFFFVRQKRIPTILCQAFVIGRDTYSGIPAWQLKLANSDNEGKWVTESFITQSGQIVHDYEDRMVVLDDSRISAGVGICPEYEMNQPYYNNIFTGNRLKVKVTSVIKGGLNGDLHHIFVKDASYKGYQAPHLINAKVISVPDGGLIRDGDAIFRNIAGSPNENTFLYLATKSVKPKPELFNKTRSGLAFVNGYPKFTDTSESSVKIVRGMYGPYVGLYGTNLIKANSLVNIYIPGYDVNLMYEYFKMRVNDESPYYPITLRKNIDDYNIEYVNSTYSYREHVYRGDCFISQFTHRINRNFQDPDAPCNETIVDSNTWMDKYDEETDATDEINRGDLNAVRIGTYITIKCYSSINLALRDWDMKYPAEEALTGNKRSFYPLSPIRIDGNSKIPESSVFNQGFSSTTGERMNFLQPTVPYIKNIFLTRVVYSDIALTDAFKNGFRIFKGVSYVDYSNQYGGITKLLEWKGNLIIVFEHAIALAAVNEKALIPTDDGTQIAVGAVKPLATTPIMISSDFGSLWSESVIKTDLYIYGVDTVAKKIWRTNGLTVECISDFKVQKFLNENITLSEKELTPIIGVRNVKTHYNAFKHDVMFTYYDNTYGFEEKVWSLCWNEYQGAQGNGFTTFYSWIPSYSANIDNIYFSYDRNSSKWIAKLNQSTYASGRIGLNTLDLDPDNGNEFELVTSNINYDDNETYYSSSGNIVLGVNLSNYTNYYLKKNIIINNSASGVCMVNPLIPSSGIFSRQLFLANDPMPEDSTHYLKFEIVRDNFGFYKYFNIVPMSNNFETRNGITVCHDGYMLLITNFNRLLDHWFTINNEIRDPLNPCIQLNIKCSIVELNSTSDQNSSTAYQFDIVYNYESQVFLTLYDIYTNYSRIKKEGRWSPNTAIHKMYRTLVGTWTNTREDDVVYNLTVELPTFETAFWKHGLSGIIDIKDRIKPCFWYGKQHPFEFEYVTGNDNAGYKQFDNLTISSNNVAPESIHYTIIGDSYDFSLLKPAMYFRQEATKAFYQYNGSDIIYDHAVFDKNLGYLPEKITSDTYIERDNAGNPLRHRSAVSTTYKDTLMPWLYTRQDTFNEVEDYYKKVTATPTYADYPNLTGGEIQWDLTLDQFSICNHVKCRDIKEVGRVRGNMQYVNDKWTILITPLNVLNRNNTWATVNNKELPKLVIDNVPAEIFEHNQSGTITAVDFPPELGVKKGSTVNDVQLDDDYLLGSKGLLYSPALLDSTSWQNIANARQEVKLLDKVLKTRIRYKGDKLAIILATATSFNIIA